MTKHCTSCKLDKPLEDFNKKGDKFQGKCRECQKEWYKNYYDTSPKEKSRLYVRNKAQREYLSEMVREIKSVPCMDCKKSYPHYVMDFDHQYDKLFNISSAVSENKSVDKIMAEIEKCEVVCANCHRERTYGKSNSYSPDPM